MAFVERWYASVTIVDTAKRASTVSLYVSEANAEAWLVAADQTARDLTDIGVFFIAFNAMTDGVVVNEKVSMERDEASITYPSDAYRGNKAIINSNTSTGVNLETSIPARTDANIPLITNSINIDVASSDTAWAAYRTALLAIAQTNQGGTATTLRDGYVNE